jgi:hypothetical protein
VLQGYDICAPLKVPHAKMTAVKSLQIEGVRKFVVSITPNAIRT